MIRASFVRAIRTNACKMRIALQPEYVAASRCSTQFVAIRFAANPHLGCLVAGSFAAMCTIQGVRHRTSVCDDSVESRIVEAKVDLVKTDGNKPTLVFVHGLDSWRGTFSSVAEECARRGFTSLSVDLRGHGESPLGRAEDFGPKQLAADVRAAVLRAGFLKPGSKFILVGHSMGGRVSMRYAAEYPEDLAALVIEDMDCVLRHYPPLTDDELKRRKAFKRDFPSWQSARTELMSFGYDEKRVDGWTTEQNPRVYPKGAAGAVWSAVNPYAQHLARQTVLCTSDGYEAMVQIAAILSSGQCNFSVHALVAGPKGTVCSWDAVPHGIHDMASVVPSLQVLEFPKAFHSIHNSEMMPFVDYLEKVASDVS